MAVSLKFYRDAALTSEISAASPLEAVQNDINSIPPVQVQLWLGSTATGKRFRDSANPGSGQIVISIIDSAPGSGQPASAVKLATSQAGLASATAGAPLNTGVTQILSGVGNAYTFWAQIDDATLTAGTYTDLSLETSEVVEENV